MVNKAICITLFIALSGCGLSKPNSTDKGQQGSIGSSESPPEQLPSAVTLTTDLPLVFSEKLASSPPVASGSGLASNGGPLSTTYTPIIPAATGIATSGSPLNSSAQIVTHQVAHLSSIDSTSTTRTINIGVTGSTNVSSCSFASPFANLSCSLAGLSVQISDFASFGNLFLNLGSGSNTVASNALAVRKFSIRQISETSQSASTDDDPFTLYGFNNKLYFWSKNANAVHKLYRFDDSALTLTTLTNLRGNDTLPDALNEGLFEMTTLNGKLLLTAHNSSGYRKLFRYSENANTIEQISHTNASAGSNDLADRFIVYNSKLYFRGNIPTSGRSKAFVYDDVAATVRQLTNVHNDSNLNDTWSAPFLHNGSLFFWGYGQGESTNYKLFKYTDGASESLVRISKTSGNDAAKDSAVAGPAIVYNNKVFFVALNTSAVYKLFRYDDTTMRREWSPKSARLRVPTPRLILALR